MVVSGVEPGAACATCSWSKKACPLMTRHGVTVYKTSPAPHSVSRFSVRHATARHQMLQTGHSVSWIFETFRISGQSVRF